MLHNEVLTKTSCKSKIRQLDNAIFGQKNVFGFDVSMQKVVQVTMIQTLQTLPNDAFHCSHWNTREM